MRGGSVQVEYLVFGKTVVNDFPNKNIVATSKTPTHADIRTPSKSGNYITSKYRYDV